MVGAGALFDRDDGVQVGDGLRPGGREGCVADALATVGGGAGVAEVDELPLLGGVPRVCGGSGACGGWGEEEEEEEEAGGEEGEGRRVLHSCGVGEGEEIGHEHDQNRVKS